MIKGEIATIAFLIVGEVQKNTQKFKLERESAVPHIYGNCHFTIQRYKKHSLPTKSCK